MLIYLNSLKIIFIIILVIYALELNFLASQKLVQLLWNINIKSVYLKKYIQAHALLYLIFGLMILIDIFIPTSIPTWWIYLLVWLNHLLICYHFGGAFNGGSDMMFGVLTTGLLISSIKGNYDFQSLGMFYIAVHSLFSYFKAGFIKMKHRDWLKSGALQSFLDLSLFQKPSWMGCFIRIKYLNILVLFFELSIFGILFLTGLIKFYFVFYFVFHLMIFFCFGLNRFFLCWLATWPAIFYFANSIHGLLS